MHSVVPDPFRCGVEPARETVVIVADGELDLAAVPVVEAQLRELHEAGFTVLTLDLAGVDFMDSSGLQLLLRWSHCIRVKRMSPAVRRVIDLAGAAAPLGLS